MIAGTMPCLPKSHTVTMLMQLPNTAVTTLTLASVPTRWYAFKVFVCKPAAISSDGEYTCQWGDTVVVTQKGGRRLGQRAHELAVSGK